LDDENNANVCVMCLSFVFVGLHHSTNNNYGEVKKRHRTIEGKERKKLSLFYNPYNQK
jgi:hypothetical protein